MRMQIPCLRRPPPGLRLLGQQVLAQRRLLVVLPLLLFHLCTISQDTVDMRIEAVLRAAWGYETVDCGHHMFASPPCSLRATIQACALRPDMSKWPCSEHDTSLALLAHAAQFPILAHLPARRSGAGTG